MPIFVYNNFWYQKLINEMQPYYAVWPIRCISIIGPIYLYLQFKTGHSHQTAIVVWAVIIFFIWQSKGKRSVPLTKQSVIACFKNSCSTTVENPWLKGQENLASEMLSNSERSLINYLNQLQVELGHGPKSGEPQSPLHSIFHSMALGPPASLTWAPTKTTDSWPHHHPHVITQNLWRWSSRILMF